MYNGIRAASPDGKIADKPVDHIGLDICIGRGGVNGSPGSVGVGAGSIRGASSALCKKTIGNCSDCQNITLFTNNISVVHS
jgi:hypothetical protein